MPSVDTPIGARKSITLFIVVIVLALMGCSSQNVERSNETTTGGEAPKTPPTSECQTPSRGTGPCGGIATVTLEDGRVLYYFPPCRPYDRTIDLPMPPP